MPGKWTKATWWPARCGAVDGEGGVQGQWLLLCPAWGHQCSQGEGFPLSNLLFSSGLWPLPLLLIPQCPQDKGHPLQVSLVRVGTLPQRA
jgi:hypothetical protein